MNKKTFSCFAWTVVFFALAAASGWFVHRRIPMPQAALIGGFAGGVILVLAISSLLGIFTRIAELMFVFRRSGSEPPDPDAPGRAHQVERQVVEELEQHTGISYGLRAAGRVVTATIAAVIFNAIAIIVVAVFCALFPPQADDLRWWEIDVERFFDQKVRTPLVASGVVSSRGNRLQELCEGCADGRLEIDGQTTELKHATYRGGRAVHLSAAPNDRDGVTLDGERVVLTRNGKSVDVPASWLQPSDIQTSLSEQGQYAGRLTVIAPEGWIRCRVSFNARVDAKAWLR
ncbi:MAG TPA: hypothetical protein VEK79_11635 [Thermoanaerobaculia bacterium]|nr:hypothetical protein [Thermoanaerobaculia bacterium]